LDDNTTSTETKEEDQETRPIESDTPHPVGESAISRSEVVLPDAEDGDTIIVTSSGRTNNVPMPYEQRSSSGQTNVLKPYEQSSGQTNNVLMPYEQSSGTQSVPTPYERSSSDQIQKAPGPYEQSSSSGDQPYEQSSGNRPYEHSSSRNHQNSTTTRPDWKETQSQKAQVEPSAPPTRQSTRSRRAADIYDSLDYDSRGRYIGYTDIQQRAIRFTSLYKALQACDIDSEFLRPEEGLLELAASLANPSADSQADEILEPVSYRDAITGPYREEWNKSMAMEVRSQKNGGTWVLVPRPEAKNVLKGRWVYKVKLGPNSKVL